jgi:ketosteroid isomerase-like protein
MKKLLFLFLLCPVFLYAQPPLEDLQVEWVQSLQAGDSTSPFYWKDRSLIFSKVTTSNSLRIKQLIKSEALSSKLTYHHQKTFKHDEFRHISVGTLENDSETMLLLTGWRYVEGDWKKEIDVLLSTESKTTSLGSELQQLLNREREQWVELANQHNPKNHITYSYTEDATYFGNGRKSDGRVEITERYFYMENPNYQVDLAKEQIWKLSEAQVLEVGRYFTGAERTGNGGLYTILWEKKADGQWQIELDFNF